MNKRTLTLCISLPIVIISAMVLFNNFAGSSLKNYKAIFAEDRKCNLFSNSLSNMNDCHYMAIKLMLEERREGKSILKNLCDRKYPEACRSYDFMTALSNLTGAPDTEPELGRYIENCTHPHIGLKKDYYACEKVFQVHNFLRNDDFAKIERVSQCTFPYSYCEKDLPLPPFTSLELNQSIFLKICNPKDVSPFCTRFSSILSFKKLVNASLDDGFSDQSKIKSIMNFCDQGTINCSEYFSDFNIIQSIANSKADINKILIFLNSLNVSFDAILSLQELSNFAYTAKKITTPSRSFKIFYAFIDNDLKGVENECKGDNVYSCYLSFANLSEASKRIDDLERYCSKGDKKSCFVATLLPHMKELGIPEGLTMIQADGTIEAYVLNHIINHPRVIIRALIHQYKVLLIALGLTIIISFLFYIFILFKQNKDVFAYIRKKTIEDIKQKLDKSR